MAKEETHIERIRKVISQATPPHKVRRRERAEMLRAFRHIAHNERTRISKLIKEKADEIGTTWEKMLVGFVLTLASLLRGGVSFVIHWMTSKRTILPLAERPELAAI